MTKNLVITKTRISTITLILVLTISAVLFALPSTTAQTAGTKQTYAFIGALPNPVGVNQEVLLHVGITDSLDTTTSGWEGLSITITDPDGEVTTIDNIRTDATGGTGRIFIPTKVGVYTIQTHFPEQISSAMIAVTGIPPNTLMLASDSEILELTVTEMEIEYYPDIELPNEYWNRPVDAQARSWSSISGNWLTAARPIFSIPFNDYAPESAHILWTKQLQIGGLAGGSAGPHAFEEGDAYEGLWGYGGGNFGPVIMAGVLYYNQYKEQGGTNVEQEVVAVNLHTGEELWRRNWNNTRLSFGQVFYWDSFNYHGVFPYLWSVTGSTWNAYNPTTGRWEYGMMNVPPGTSVYAVSAPGTNIYGPKGEIYRYTINTNAGWMTLWNSSRVPESSAVDFNVGSWGSNVLGQTFDARTGIEWNVTIPTGLPGPLGFEAAFGPINVISHENVLIGSNVGIGIGTKSNSISYWGLSLKPGEEGTLLFNKTWQLPSANLTMGINAVSEEDGIFILTAKERRQFWGFNLTTGEQIWGPTEPQIYLDAYQIAGASQGPDTSWWAGGSVATAEGKLFSASIGGIVYAYNITTGNFLWKYEADDPYNEILWSNNWPIRTLFITDGKIYLGHDEHSPIDPKPRGAPFICLNITNGEEIFRANGLFRQTEAGARAIIGDSIIATMDTYDQRIYAIGKGPSVITANVRSDVTLGNSATIFGMVIDVSPGTESSALRARFPNGVPAVADKGMSDWMLYVYKQFPRPANAVGVPIKLTTVDPNNNSIDIGTATTDAYGNYGFSYKPEVPGTYLIIATFEGSKSYYGAKTTTYLTVDPAPPMGGGIEPEAQVPLITTEVAIIVAVVVIAAVALVAYWILKKRK